ncbi:MAG: Ig-like domain-containing protein [Thermoplasmatota archaeon]
MSVIEAMDDLSRFYGRSARVKSVVAILIASFLLLGSLLVIIPDEADAATQSGGTLVNDEPARTIATGGFWSWSSTDELRFKIPTKANYYTAVASLNRNAGEDFDLFLYSDYDMENEIASSTSGTDVIDVVVSDGHTYGGGFKYGLVTKFTGKDWSQGVRIESDYHCVEDDLQSSDPDDDGPLEVGVYRHSLFQFGTTGTYSNTLDEAEPLINMYDIYLDAGGRYTFDLEFNSGTTGQRLGMYLFKGSGNLDDALVSDVASAVNEELSFSFNPDLSGYYGLLVLNWNYASSSNQYSLLVSSDFEMSAEPTSQLISPGMNTSFRVDISSLGITGDIDLSYEWRDSSGPISTPSGAAASLNVDEVVPGGVHTNQTYLNITTTSSLSAGTYYLRVYGNDTGVGGSSHNVTVTLKVSTQPDFFLSAAPERRTINPGGSTTFKVDMDTINNFTSSVSLSGSSVPSEATLNFTFNPSSISASSPMSNLTISTTASTPKGEYTVSISGTGGSITRYANVSLKVQEPLNIQVLAPATGEIVSGVYTFKIKAGSPATVDELKLTFGGKMASLGTLTTYYNSADGAWERSVSTFTFNDGASWFNITARDAGGGYTYYGPVNFTLSNSAPNPIIITPIDRSYVTGSNLMISVNTTSHVISSRFRVDQNAWSTMTRSGTLWTGYYDTTIINDGDHTLSVEAKDSAGLTGTSTVTIYVDNNDPTCTMNSPIDGQYIEDSYTFRTIATDTVGIHHVNITVFGVSTTLPYNPITSSFEYTVSTGTKADGKYTVYSTAYDKVGQTKMSDVITFYIDNNAPSLSIKKPADDEIIGGTYTISVTSSDTHLNKVEYMIDSGGWMNFTGSEPLWSAVIDTSQLSDGDHTLSVRSVDNASHITEQAIDFTVDNTYPTCNIVSPFTGAFIEGVYTFKISSSDAVGVDKVLLDIFSDTVQMTYNMQTGYFEYSYNTMTVTDGNYSAAAHAYDRSNKLTNSSEIWFNVDNQAPEMTVNELQTGDYISGMIDLNVTVSDAFLRDVRYSVDGGGWIAISTTWDTTALLDGPHTLSIMARDLAGHTATQTMNLKVDNNLPVCAVNGPVPKEFIKGAYTFRLSATDQVGIDRVEINVFGTNFTAIYSSSSGYYEYTTDTSIQADGNYSCYSIVYDLSGKKNVSKPVAFQIDNNAPVLRINDPVDGSYLEGMVTLDVSAADVFLEKVEYDIDGSGYVPINTPLNTSSFGDGTHTIRFKATDKAGHVTVSTISVKIDNNNPTGSISNPVAEQFMEGTVKFSAFASDAVGVSSVKITVFGSVLDMSYNTGSGSYEYWTDTRLIKDGTYSMTVDIVDNSGKNITLGPRTFYIDNNAPILRVNYPISGSYLEGEEMIRVSSTDTFLDRVEYNVDGTGWVPINTTLNTTGFSDGPHSISIRALDLAGHSTLTSVDVRFDNNNPTGSISSPVSKQFLEATALFSVIANDVNGIDSVVIDIFGASIEMNYNSGTGTYDYRTDTRLIQDGTYEMNITIEDMSGKVLHIGPRVFYVDNTAPVLRVNHPIVGAYLEGFETMDINATDVFLDRVEYDVDGTGWLPINTTLNTSLFSDGPHLISFRAVDRAGHVTTTSSSVLIDNTAPYGSITSPETKQFISGQYLFRAVASDIVGVESVRISVFNTTLDMNYNSGSGYYEYRTDTTLISDSIYNLTITVTDLSGKVTVVGPRSFYLDNHVPQLEVYNLNNGDIISAVISFDYFANDTFLDIVQYQVDTTGWYDIGIPLNTTRIEDGDHVIRIRAVDLSGKSMVLDFDIMVDNIGPTCTINSPVEDEFVEGIVNIRVTAFDIVGVDYVVIKVYDIEAKVPYNANTGYYEYSSNTITWGAGEDGIRNVTATAYDYTGKSYTFGPVFFNVDNRAPTINIKSPSEGQVVSGLFFFDVENGDIFKKGTDYNIDGASWQPVSIGWNTLLVPDGSHEVTIRATDKAGHITLETIHVLVDNNDPEIEIASPSNNEFVEGTYVFRMVVYDEVGIKRVVINIADEEKPLSYNTQTGYYEYLLDTRSLPDGIYTVNGSVTDLAMRTVKTGDITFKVDNTDPVLVIETPMKDQLISGLFVIRATTHDVFAGPVTYAIDGTTWYDISTPWNTTKIGDGIHTVTIRSVDQSGRQTSFDISVIVDNSRPVISQASIASGQILSGIHNLRFYAYDGIGLSQVTLKVGDASPFEIYRGEAGLYYEYLLDTRSLGDGDHTLMVTARDRAGNEYSAEYGIKVDNTGPVISLDYYWIEGTEQVRIGTVESGNSVVFAATVVDPSGVASVMINIDSSGWREMTPDSNESNPDTYVLFWPTGDSEGGSHVFQIRTSDTLGNENLISGLIDVERKKDKDSFGKMFKDSLPILWFILFIILIIVIIVLAYTGILTKWARGEGMQKKEKPEVPEEEGKKGGLIGFKKEKKEPSSPASDEGKDEPKRSRNPFKKTSGEKKEKDDEVAWMDDEKKGD